MPKGTFTVDGNTVQFEVVHVVSGSGAKGPIVVDVRVPAAGWDQFETFVGALGALSLHEGGEVRARLVSTPLPGSDTIRRATFELSE
jgi:hypothetical protein